MTINLEEDEAAPVAAVGQPVEWERIRWPDDEPLPAAGLEISLAAHADGRMTTRLVRVVTARPDFEPGWVGVEVVPA